MLVVVDDICDTTLASDMRLWTRVPSGMVAIAGSDPSLRVLGMPPPRLHFLPSLLSLHTWESAESADANTEIELSWHRHLVLGVLIVGGRIPNLSTVCRPSGRLPLLLSLGVIRPTSGLCMHTPVELRYCVDIRLVSGLHFSVIVGSGNGSTFGSHTYVL